MSYRYFNEGKTKMIEIEVDPTNTVVREATPEDLKNYPPKDAKKHDDEHEDKHK